MARSLTPAVSATTLDLIEKHARFVSAQIAHTNREIEKIETELAAAISKRSALKEELTLLSTDTTRLDPPPAVNQASAGASPFPPPPPAAPPSRPSSYKPQMPPQWPAAPGASPFDFDDPR